MNVVYFGIYPGRCYDFLCHYRTSPPPFLIGFGRIRKLTSAVRKWGVSSPPRGAATVKYLDRVKRAIFRPVTEPKDLVLTAF